MMHSFFVRMFLALHSFFGKCYVRLWHLIKSASPQLRSSGSTLRRRPAAAPVPCRSAELAGHQKSLCKAVQRENVLKLMGSTYPTALRIGMGSTLDFRGT